MLKLKRLKVLHYRNVAPGCELRFDDGINLVLGQNASGKTTLLALISAVCRSSFAGIKDEEFELEYEIESERFSVRAQVAHRQVPRAEEDAFPAFAATWDDSFNVEISDRATHSSRHFSSDDSTHDLSHIDLIMEWSFIALLAEQDPALRPITLDLATGYTHSFRFDESLDCFASMTGRESVIRGPASPSIARASVLDRRTRRNISPGPFTPGSIPLLLGEAPPSQDIPLAQKMARHLGATAVAIHANIREQRISGDERSYQIEGFTFQITRPDGTTIHHDRLSYGQKRLLAFLYYLECNPAVVIADELVNGLHHRWIDACMNELGERQAFLTSQNPLLFDYATFDSVERVQSSFLICGLELRDGREEMVWRNMSRDDAQVFFDAYQAGVEHVGDILITRGLW